MPVDKLIEHVADSHSRCHPLCRKMYRPTWRSLTNRPAPPVFDADDVDMVADAILDNDHPRDALNRMLAEAHAAEVASTSDDEKGGYYLAYARMVRLACRIADWQGELSRAVTPRKPGQTDKRIDVRDLKNTVDIVSYIDNHVRLVKHGSYFQAPCPFHDDRSPSFTVWPDGHWKCFGCGKGGDIVTFVQEWYKVDFKEAVQIIAGGT